MFFKRFNLDSFDIVVVEDLVGAFFPLCKVEGSSIVYELIFLQSLLADLLNAFLSFGRSHRVDLRSKEPGLRLRLYVTLHQKLLISLLYGGEAYAQIPGKRPQRRKFLSCSYGTRQDALFYGLIQLFIQKLLITVICF